MFYRKVNRTYSGNITAQDLSISVLDDQELQQDYDTAVQTLVQISPGEKVEGNDFQLLPERQWEFQTNVIIDRLHSCAAVLFYNGTYQLIAAYHAFGGMIDTDDPNAPSTDDVSFLIYATPKLPKSSDVDYESYRDVLNNLSAKYNTAKICIIDGFAPDCNGTIVANCKGQLKFS